MIKAHLISRCETQTYLCIKRTPDVFLYPHIAEVCYYVPAKMHCSKGQMERAPNVQLAGKSRSLRNKWNETRKQITQTQKKGHSYGQMSVLRT